MQLTHLNCENINQRIILRLPLKQTFKGNGPKQLQKSYWTTKFAQRCSIIIKQFSMYWL